MFNNKKIEQLDLVINKLDSRIAFLERKEDEQVTKIFALNKKYANLLKHLGLEEVILKGTPEETKLMTKDEIKKNKDKIKPESYANEYAHSKAAAAAMEAACSSNFYLNTFKFWG